MNIFSFFKKTRILDTYYAFFPIILVSFFGEFTNENILRLIVVVLIQYHIFFYNDYCDRNEDKKNVNKKKRNLFCDRKSKEYVFGKIWLICIFVLSITIPLFFDISFLLYAIFGIFFNLIYNHPKIRFRNKPFLDVLWHGTWPVFIVFPFLINADLIFRYKRYIILFLFWSGLISQMGQQVRDFKSDRRNRVNNTVQYFCKNRNKANKILNKTFIAMSLLFSIFSIYEKLYLLFVYLLFSIYFMTSKFGITGKSRKIFNTIFLIVLLLDFLVI